eukprot:203933_1
MDRNRRTQKTAPISSKHKIKPKSPRADYYGAPAKCNKSAMFYFIDSVSDSYKQRYPTSTKHFRSMKMKDEWRSLSYSERNPYFLMQMNDQRIYDRDFNKWKQTQQYRKYQAECGEYNRALKVWKEEERIHKNRNKNKNKHRKVSGHRRKSRHKQRKKIICDSDTSTDDKDVDQPPKKKQRTSSIDGQPINTKNKRKCDSFIEERCKYPTLQTSELPEQSNCNQEEDKEIEMKDIMKNDTNNPNASTDTQNVSPDTENAVAFMINASYSGTSKRTHMKILYSTYSTEMDVMVEYTGITEQILQLAIDYAYYINPTVQSFKPHIWSASILPEQNTKNCFTIKGNDNFFSHLRDGVAYSTSTPAHMIAHKWIAYKQDYSVDVETILNWNSKFSLGFRNNDYMNNVGQCVGELDKIDYNMLTRKGGFGMSIDASRIKMYKSGIVVFDKNVLMNDKMEKDDGNDFKVTITMLTSQGYMYFAVNGVIVSNQGIELSTQRNKFSVFICGLNAQKFKINSNRK